jgi:DNA-binding transcriptional MocR family regulator
MLSRLIKWAKSLNISPQLKALVRSLIDYWNISKQNPFPSIKRLAEELCVSRQTIHKYLNKLEAAGIIARKKRFRADGGRTSNTYRLLHSLHAPCKHGVTTIKKSNRNVIHAGKPNVIYDCDQKTELPNTPSPKSISPDNAARKKKKSYTIDPKKMTSLDECKRHHSIAIERKWIDDSDRTRLSYFSSWAKVMRKYREGKAKNPAALLVHILKQNLIHKYPDNIDEQKALKIIRVMKAEQFNSHIGE